MTSRVGRTPTGKIELRPEFVDLASVVNGAVETSAPVLEGRRHELTVVLPSEPVWVRADPTRLAQVVSNLLNNAAKYTDPGGQVRLTACAEDGQAVLRVRDTGVGIPADMLPRVFELFTQVEQTLDRAQGGLGIGLTLVRSLVEMHEGSVTASSEGTGKGSEFAVRLPLATRPGKASPEQAAKQPRHADPLRVLVVDDNVDSAESLAMLLRVTGHEVRTAHDGQAGVDLAAAYHPDAVLLDLGLPKLNGYESARRIRQQEGRPLLIALTGWGQPEDRQRSREAGFDHHLVKPVDFEALQGLLARQTRRG